MPTCTHLRPADYRRMRWKNGAGWTTELAVQDGREGFDWRISVAEIDADGEFSRFPAVDRSILVLDGAGMALSVDGDAPAVLRGEDPALAFAGERAAACRLLAGPTRDFNVMTRRGVYTHTLERHALAGPLALAGECFVYVVSGAVQLGEIVLAAGDSLRIAAVPGDRPVTLHGAAQLVVVWLRRGGSVSAAGPGGR